MVFFTSIIRFRTPTEGDYVYPFYANVLGWLMVCSSLIFIPGVMIYELIKAWRITGRQQYQVNGEMPHYLRMLTYAIQPETDWGPGKDENRHGRYAPKIRSENDSRSIVRVRF